MPFTGTDEIHMRAPTCKYADSKSGFNDMVGIEIRYRQGNLAVFFIEVTEGAEVVSHSGMEMNVRSPVLSYRHPERSRGIFTPWRCTACMREREKRLGAAPHLTLSVSPVCKEDFSLRSK